MTNDRPFSVIGDAVPAEEVIQPVPENKPGQKDTDNKQNTDNKE